MRLSERIYRILLNAYPNGYLARYKEPMAQLFADQLRHAPEPLACVRLWVRTLADLLRTLPARYLELLIPHNINLFSEAARRSLFFASYEAVSSGSANITPEHMLLGVLRQDAKIRSFLSQETLEDIRQTIGVSDQPHKRVSLCVDLPLSQVSKRILERADEEAKKAESVQIAPCHLLAAIRSEGQTLAAGLVSRHHIDAGCQ